MVTTGAVSAINLLLGLVRAGAVSGVNLLLGLGFACAGILVVLIWCCAAAAPRAESAAEAGWRRVARGAQRVARIRRVWAALGTHLRIVKARGHDPSQRGADR